MGIAPNSRQNNVKPDARSAAPARANGHLSGKTSKPKGGNRAIRVETAKPAQQPRANQQREGGNYAPEFTEDGLALAFAQRYSDRFRWMEEWHCWMEWTGTQWRKVKTLVVYDLIRKLCREAAGRVDTSTAGGERLAADLNTAKKRSAVQTIARSDKRFEAVSEQWDADDWLLGTPGGIIDLRTGQNIGFNPLKYITLTTSVAPGGECPTWLKFVDQITKGDEDLQGYLQRKCGYDLTGSTEEQSLTFIYGEGGNGKGVFLGVQAGVMGPLHKTADVETFMERKYQTHTTDVANLHEARSVACQETGAGQYWDEPKLKKLTGGDPITARFMRCDNFTFVPKFNLTIVGNHKPKFRSVDEAIRRRLHLIPFDYKVTKADRDVNLAKKLKAEWPGILAWMVEGCLEWQKRGLDAPECVLTATNEYLESEDMVGQWFAQNCIREPGARVKNNALFTDWKEWADSAHVAVGDVRNLAAEIAKRHGESNRYMRDKVLAWKNLRLKTFEERCGEDAEDARQAKKGGEGCNSFMERSRTRAHAQARRPTEGDHPLPPLTASQANGRNSSNSSSKPEGERQAKGGAQLKGLRQPSKLGDNDHSNFDAGDAEHLPPLPSSPDEYGCGDRRWLDEHPAPARGHAVNGGGNRASNSKTLKVAL